MNLLTLEEIASKFRKSTKTFSRLVKAHSIPHIKLGRSMLFDAAKVELYLESIHFETKPQRRLIRRPAREVGRFAGRLGL